MTAVRVCRLAIVLGAPLLLASCAEFEAEMSAQAAAVSHSIQAATGGQPEGGTWNGEGVSGPPKIIVSLTEQRALFYKGKRVVGESTVSTGKPGFSTPPGQYHVVSKDKDHVSSAFGEYVDDAGNVVKSNVDSRKDARPAGTHFAGAHMPYCMHFNGGYAMHAGYVPRYRASHGCIRLPAPMAAHFFDAASEGTPVIVKE